MKKSVLRNFTKFTGKHLCQSIFFDKVAGLRLQNTPGRLLLIVRETLGRTFFPKSCANCNKEVVTELFKKNFGVFSYT